MNATAMATVPADDAITDAEVEQLFAAQQTFALALRASSAAQRIAKIKRLKQLLWQRRGDVQRACHADFRKPAAEVDITEILPVLHEANNAMRHLRQWMRPRRVRPTRLTLGNSGSIRHEPRGVCLLISPWNYPINLTLGPLVSAIAAGNTVIVKPSEMTPHCAALLQELIAAVFEPAEVAVVQGGVNTTQRLLAKPFDHIFFTGSPAVGKIVMRAAAEHLASVTLELGGKSPAIVDASADVAKAARSIVWAKFANSGQTCIAPDYVYLHAAVYDAFIAAAQTALRKLYGSADNMAANADYCRMVNRRHFERVTALLDDATAQGATLIHGGATDAGDHFIAPTLIAQVPATARIMHEEIFGPVLPLLRYDDGDTMLAAVNRQPKPLALYLYARDNAVIDHVLAHTSAGGSCVNTALIQYMHGNLPFGGVNNSGFGNAHGHWGFKAFSHERAVVRERRALTGLFMPPFGRLTRWGIRFALKYLS